MAARRAGAASCPVLGEGGRPARLVALPALRFHGRIRPRRPADGSRPRRGLPPRSRRSACSGPSCRSSSMRLVLPRPTSISIIAGGGSRGSMRLCGARHADARATSDERTSPPSPPTRSACSTGISPCGRRRPATSPGSGSFSSGAIRPMTASRSRTASRSSPSIAGGSTGHSAASWTRPISSAPSRSPGCWSSPRSASSLPIL